VRNAVWDWLHGMPLRPPAGDVDVIWHDPQCLDARRDREIEALLAANAPDVDWSVKNQARMHARNGDAPYSSAIDAMRYWPETATAVAARRLPDGRCEIAAPLGLDDLLGIVARPGPRFHTDRRHIFSARVHDKQWASRWPMLVIASG
jgi:hypothetical protein